MRKLPTRLVLLFLALAPCALSGAEAQSDKDGFFRVEDLRPGMKGVGRTCFQGTEPEDFGVEILGVLRGVSPGADAVLARFSGEKLERVGVFEGMSGSPVFIDGKLLGAVAFSYAYSKEAIGGITPITQMVAAVEEGRDDTPRHPQSAWTTSGSRNAGWRSAHLGEPEVRAPGALLPISTPVSLGGFDPRAVKAFAPAFRQAGMSLLEGTGIGRASNPNDVIDRPGEPPFRPGDNIVVSLVEGDMDVSAGGTVTWVDGDRLYAFGHELMTLGLTELPMRRAAAITVIPNLESSFKVLEAGATAGTIRQDRSSGIFGVIGERPRMTPVRVRLKTSRSIEKTFRYEVVRDALLTPLLVNLTLYNTIVASEREQGALTLRVQGKIHMKGQPDVAVDNRFSSDDGTAGNAALSVALPVNDLMAPGYENLEIEGIDIEIEAQEKNLSSTLESVRLDRTEARAGETVELTVSSIKANGTASRQRYPVKIPETTSPGSLSLMVADGNTLTLLDAFDDAAPAPRDPGQLIRRLNDQRKSDRLYARLFRREAGAVTGGEKLPGLPPTILSILNSARETGSVGALRSTTLMEYELPATELLPAGSATLELVVR